MLPRHHQVNRRLCPHFGGQNGGGSGAVVLSAAPARVPRITEQASMKNEPGLGIQLCPSCNNPTRDVRNPFYGSGLSVHEWIAVCDICKWSAFEPNPDDEPDVSTDASDQRRKPWFRALLGRRR